MDEENTQTVGVLRDHPFFSELPIAMLAPLAEHARIRNYDGGRAVFRERQPADRFFLLRSGRIRLDMEHPARGQLPVEVLADDAVLGWSWLFPPYRWHLTATALQPTSLVVFDAYRLRGEMSDNPELGYQLMRRFAALLFDRLHAIRVQLTNESASGPLPPGR